MNSPDQVEKRMKLEAKSNKMFYFQTQRHSTEGSLLMTTNKNLMTSVRLFENRNTNLKLLSTYDFIIATKKYPAVMALSCLVALVTLHTITTSFWKDSNIEDIVQEDDVGYVGDRNTEGQRHGKGTWNKTADNNEVYEGEWLHDKMNGHGYLRNSVGYVYFGDFLNNRFHGHGCLKIPFCGTYCGQFAFGRIEGKGVFKYKDGSKYSGEFHNNMIHGNGVFHHANGDVYDGKLRNNQMHGQGVYKYVNGDVFCGQYESNVIHGHGKLQFCGSEVVEIDGNWEDGKLHGKGACFYRNGDIYKGTWEEDVHTGSVVFIRATEDASASNTVNESDVAVFRTRSRSASINSLISAGDGTVYFGYWHDDILGRGKQLILTAGSIDEGEDEETGSSGSADTDREEFHSLSFPQEQY